MTYNPLAQAATPQLFSAVDNITNLPLAGGKLYTYASGTITPQATFTDNTLTVPMPNPIILDNYGQAIFWLSDVNYRYNLISAQGIQQAHYPQDNIQPQSTATFAAQLAASANTSQGQGLVGFNPSLTYASGTLPSALASAVAGQGDSLITTLAATMYAVSRTQHQKNSDTISIKDFGAIGDGTSHPLSGVSLLGSQVTSGWSLAQWQGFWPHVTSLTNELDWASIQASVNYVNSLPSTPLKPGIFVPAGRYLINSTIQLYNSISLQGVARDIGYSTGFTHSSEFLASTTMGSMIDVSGGEIHISDLGLYGQNAATYGLYTSGTFGRFAPGFTFARVALSSFTISGVYLNNTGIAKMNNLQISNCVSCGIDLSGSGDTDIDGCYINTNTDATNSLTVGPSSAAVLGVGIRLRADTVSGGAGPNVNIRGGKIEFNKIGVLINAGGAVNINGVNLDSNALGSVVLKSDSFTAGTSLTTYNSGTVTSVQIDGCRFIGGAYNAAFTRSAHIYVENCRYITVAGNGFKRSSVGAADFYGSAAPATQGPVNGIYLYNAEQCTVVGNDLYGAAQTCCLRVENATPSYAQHVIQGNNTDGTEVVNPGMLKVPVLKAMVRFNGNGGSPVIFGSAYNCTVTGSGGTYTVAAINAWGANVAVTTNCAAYFGQNDKSHYGTITASSVVIYTDTAGALSANGDITVIIYGT